MRLLRDLAISVLIALCLLALIEAGLRIAYPDTTIRIKDAYSDRRAYIFDDLYGRALRPNHEAAYHREQVNGGDRIVWKTNSLGFRGPDLVANPDLRIVVYGDSNVQARFSAFENTFAEQLAGNLRRLPKRDNNVIEVINAGIIGFGPDQSLLRFQHEAPQLRSDIVVFHIFTDNDFGDILRNASIYLDESGTRIKEIVAHPAEERSIKGYIAVSMPPLILTHVFGRGILEKLSGANERGAGLTGAVGKQSVFSIERRIERLSAAVIKDYDAYQARDNTWGDHYDLDVALHPDSASARLKIKLMEAVLREAKTFAASIGTAFLVVIQPSPRDITTNLSLSYKYLENYENYKSDRLSSIVAEICQRNTIPYVNLYPTFYERDPNTLYFSGTNDHWNDKGQMTAAEVVSSYIDEELLPNIDLLSAKRLRRHNSKESGCALVRSGRRCPQECRGVTSIHGAGYSAIPRRELGASCGGRQE